MVDRSAWWLLSIFAVCRSHLRVTGETISHTHRHPHTVYKSTRELIFSLRENSFIASVHKRLYFCCMLCLPLWTEEKYQQSPLHICPVYSQVGLVERRPLSASVPSPQFCVSGICVCASSCLLNIIGIRAGGLIKKQLPLVAVGDGWRRVAQIIWWMVRGTLGMRCTHTHVHARKLCNCLQN